MHPTNLVARFIRRLGLIVDALGDPSRQNRTAAALIAVYVLLWWAYAVVAKGTQGIHFDMGEQFAWSLQPAFGYPKHPPFCAWIVALWFAVFPRTDWAFYLLSISVIGAALWFIWLIVARFVEGGEKRAMALMLLVFAPPFNFLSLKYNPNSMLIAVWAAASWLFLRSFERRTALWGIAAGVGAAIAMLTKYWSFFLILAFIVAALADARRAEYLRSPAPWWSIIAGAVLLAGNMVSLVEYNFGPITYAAGAHTARSDIDSLRSIGGYLSGLLYIVGGFLALQLAARPSMQAWRDMLWPPPGDRRLMVTVILVSLLTPMAFALALTMEVDAFWNTQCWAMLPAMLMSSPRPVIDRRAAGMVLIAPYIFVALALAVAPVVAVMVLRNGLDHSAIYLQAMSRQADRLWRGASDRPLAYVTGPQALAWACSFYCADRPRALPNFSFHQAPWIERADVLRKGFVALCETSNAPCMDEARKLAGAAVAEHEVEIRRRAYGFESAPRRFTFVVSPPRTH